MKPHIELRWRTAAVAVAVAGAIGFGLLSGQNATSAAANTGQVYNAACPAADVLTPALNSNLIENPGAEDYTAVTGLGAPSGDTQDVPDCWTASSPMSAPGAVLESAATASVPGQSGARTFYGGYDDDSPQISIVGVTTTATQLIDLTSLDVGGKAFTLTGEIGGYTTQTDYATVTAKFQDADGAALGTATLGPVNAAQRNDVTSLIPQAATGTVPAGTTRVLVTVASTGVSAGYGIDGRADNLDLTISASGAGQSYTAPCPAADKVTAALDTNLIENPGAEDYTAVTDLGAASGDAQTVADCWTSNSPLAAPDATQESATSTDAGVTGSRVFYGGAGSGTDSAAGLVTSSTQLIDVSALKAGGRPFKLTGDVGGTAEQSDYAEVLATFEDAGGASLGTAQIGPATAADRANVSELLPDGVYGTLPANTAKILVTVVTGAVTLASADTGTANDGVADELDLTIGQTASGQTWTAPCPSADTVTAALDTNLIENPGAEDYTAATALGAPLTDDQTIADCWTSASPLSPVDGTQESRASTYPGVTGKRDFYGGTNPSTVSIPGISTTDTQKIDLSGISVDDQAFELSAELGGYATQADFATVTAAFQDAKGDTLGSAVIGPVSAAQRDNVSSLIPQAWYGTVPAGAKQVVVTIATVGVSSGANSDGAADNLDLTIGHSAVPAGPVLQTMPYSSVGDNPGTHIDPGSGAIVPNVVPGSLYRPAGISVENGSVYVSNTGDNVVARLLDGSTSIIAGSLEASGEAGDGGKATSATLYQPNGIAVDAKGDVFVADSGDHAIREITASGRIERFASGYRLEHPEGIAVDAAGEVYVSDTYDNRVIEFSSHGSVLRVIGNGHAGYAGDGRPAVSAQLNQPIGLALDAKGNLYIADSANNVVRRLDAKTGRISTVAGNHGAGKANGGLGAFTGDGGPATSAQLNDPQGVALDGAGDLFIADTFDNAIREVAPDGTISTAVNASAAAGGETSGAAPTDSALNTPGAVTLDPSTDLLYIADTSNSAVAQVLGVARTGDAAGPTAPAGS